MLDRLPLLWVQGIEVGGGHRDTTQGAQHGPGLSVPGAVLIGKAKDGGAARPPSATITPGNGIHTPRGFLSACAHRYLGLMLDADARTAFLDSFRRDVVEGLAATQKSLPARWLYDDQGSALFEAITRLPEYYPTRTETRILADAASELAGFVGPGAVLVEYGAGAAVKTEVLVAALEPAAYVPIDIAADFLGLAAARVQVRFSQLTIRPVAADFMADFALPRDLPAGRRVGFFPGSTIGNLTPDEARAFLARMARQVGPQGAAIVGVDLKKDIPSLLAAYDDDQGVTARFNLNLLARINRELGGDFDLAAFRHEARWNAAEAGVEMHAVSTRRQTVVVDGMRFPFEAGETIHTESSRKFDLQGFAGLAASGGWRAGPIWTDAARRFAVFGLIAGG
jgi:dimethylhistidine N-methyltransferase